jgi:hypothetical protein
MAANATVAPSPKTAKAAIEFFNIFKSGDWFQPRPSATVLFGRTTRRTICLPHCKAVEGNFLKQE